MKIKIHNQLNQREIYTINIKDPDETVVIEPEFKVVSDKAEWRHWVAQGKCAAPKSYEFVTENGDIDLPPNEEIEILVKFLSIREVPVVAGDLNSYPP
jgi:hypothetical protein